MIKNSGTNEELLKELADLKLEFASLKVQYEQNITARKVEEETMREREELFRIISDLTTHYIFFAKITGNEQIEIKWVLGAYQEITGYSIEEYKSIGHWRMTVHPDDLEKDNCDFQKLLKNENVISEIRTLHKNGNIVWLRTYAHPIWNEKANKLVGVSGAVQDITEYKRLDEVLHQSEDRYRDLVENSSDLICTHDLDGNLLSVNNAAINISGYSKEEAIKMNMRDLVVPEYRRIFNAYLAKIKAMGHAQGLMIIQTKTGERRIWEYNNTLRTEDIAKPIVRGMVKDVTKLKSDEAILKKLNAELNKSNSEKDKFFSIIAHDLRSPFSGFLGLTQNIAQNASNISGLELAQLGNTMYRAADNLFNLLQNLLEWAQMQSGSISLLQKDISLSKLIAGNVQLIKERSEQKGISINNMVLETIHAYADEKMINSVLLNLLSNAVKFTNRNGIVTINAKKTENQMIEIAICDSGIGMEKDLVERLFKTGEKTGRKGTDGELSTGLGLLLCKEFVEMHCGRIWVESQENIGSTFYFTIPFRNKSY